MFQCCKSPAFWPGCCWERNSVVSRMTVHGLLSPLERSCPPCGNCCCCCSPSAHTHQPFKPRFCDLGTPWPLGDQRTTVCAAAKNLWAVSLYLLPSCPHFQVLLSPSLSLTNFFTTHNIHQHLPTLQMQAEDAPLAQSSNLLKEISPCKSRGWSAAFREFHLIATLIWNESSRKSSAEDPHNPGL